MEHHYITKKEFDEAIAKIEEQRATDLRELKDILLPMAETYRTARVLGKWFMGLMVFISIMLGIVLSVQNVLKK